MYETCLLNPRSAAARPRIVSRQSLRWAYSVFGGVPSLAIGLMSSGALINLVRGPLSGPEERLQYAFQASTALAVIWSLAGGSGTVAGWYAIWGTVPRSRHLLAFLIALVVCGLAAALGLVLLGGDVAALAALTLAVGICLLVHLFQAKSLGSGH